MSAYNALNRLKWRFTTGKEFKPNQNDINALNELIDFYSGVENSVLRENMAFSKLFVRVLTVMIHHLEIDLFSDGVQKRMHGILSLPYEELIRRLTETMNDIESYKMIEDKDPKHLQKQWEEKEVMELVNKYILNALVYGNQ